jgi:hypothetical protein
MNITEVKQEIFTRSFPGMKEVSKRPDHPGRGHLIGNVNRKRFSFKPAGTSQPDNRRPEYFGPL